jgi:hypothetical protein
MARPKKLENMTHEERCAFWANERELARKDRETRLADITPKMRKALFDLVDISAEVGEELFTSGPKYVTVHQMHKLVDLANLVKEQFNIGDDDNDL